MKIIVCTHFSGQEYETSHLFVKALKRMGHVVCTAGPEANRFDINLPKSFNLDIDLPDKKFPELYTYTEVLDKAPWIPDCIIQVEPHFYLTGNKPKDIKSYYWVLDPHRGGKTYRDLALQGNFDAVLITHRFFVESYASKDIKCYFFPFSLDSEEEKYDPSIIPECDISFSGDSGISNEDLIFNQVDNDGFEYCDHLPDKIRFNSLYGDYTERAMLLKHLMKDFKIRIYKRYFGKSFSRLMQKGVISFQRSINNIPGRIFEAMACKRVLLADDVFGIDELLTHMQNAIIYRQYKYNPILTNFDLDYESLKNWVVFLLENKLLRELITENAHQLVYARHTFACRIKTLEKIIDGKV